MPGYKSHILIGTASVSLILYIIHRFQEHIPYISTELTGLDWIVLVTVTYLYSQLPDLDADASKINKIWNTTAGLGAVAAIVANKYKWIAVFVVLSIVALEWVKHRGFTHDVWFAVLLSLPLIIYNPLIAVVGFVAYLSHIIADGEFGK